MKEWIKNNKSIIIVSLIFVMSIFYCSLNTFIVNDDLGYSFFYRTNVRVTNIVQAFKNQVSDYFIVNSRVFIHFIVHTLLIFGKNVWALLNPIVILINGIFISKIISIYHKNKSRLFNIITYLVCFLLIINFKWLIYWLTGSLNYVWTSTIIFAFIYFYLKKGFLNNYLINCLIVLLVSILHDCTFIFMLIFLIFKVLKNIIIDKKSNKKDLLLFIPIIISGCFLFLSPGTRYRMSIDSANANIIKRLIEALPFISQKLFAINNVYNIIPLLFIISLLLKLSFSKYKYKTIITIILSGLLLCSLLINNNWIYFGVSIFIILCLFYINYLDKRDDLSIISLAFYAIPYSLSLTSEYVSGRPNYFFYIYLIFLIILFLNDILSNKMIKYISLFLVIILGMLLGLEIKAYHDIGVIKKEREQAINNYNHKGTLYLKKMPSKYIMYQMDGNEPGSKNYYAYDYYLNYYGLDRDIIIEFK